MSEANALTTEERIARILKDLSDSAELARFSLEDGRINVAECYAKTEAAQLYAKAQVLALINEERIDPFDFVEPCEPDCSKERHTYHQGQWDMAERIQTLSQGGKK